MSEKMRKEVKEYFIRTMNGFQKGLVGLLAIEVERSITSVPAPRIGTLMAMEIVIEADARKSKKDPDASVGRTFDKSRQVADLVREYIRGLSDEEFDAFTSQESIEEATKMALDELSCLTGHADKDCSSCGEDDQEKDESKDPNKIMN